MDIVHSREFFESPVTITHTYLIVSSKALEKNSFSTFPFNRSNI